MNRKLILIITILSALLSSGCKKFLDVQPSTQSINPSTIADFREMLNSDSLSVGNYFLLDLMTDDVALLDATVTTGLDNYFTRSYLWKSQIWNAADNDNMYSGAYARILQMNIILNRINNAPLDSLNTTENRSNIISQALINRSWNLLQLANTYGAAYNDASAQTDLAVPLVLSPDVSALPSRATVKQVYHQVLTDLHMAVNNPYLPAKGSDIIHPGKAAGYALLSRTYLYMASYDSAKLYADSSLLLVNTLTNYTAGYTRPTQLLDMRNDREILMGKIAYEQSFYALLSSTIVMSNSMAAIYSANDVRNTARYTRGSYLTSQYNNLTTLVFDCSLGIAEVMLIKAECLARKGDYTGAMALVNNLAANRIRNYTPVTNYDASNTLTYVLNERRRELLLHGGLRLFDLKRLNMQSATAITLQRKKADGTVMAELPALSSRYLMPFSPLVLANNPNIVQNVRQ